MGDPTSTPGGDAQGSTGGAANRPADTDRTGDTDRPADTDRTAGSDRPAAPDQVRTSRPGLLQGRLLAATAAVAVGVIAAVLVINLTGDGNPKADPADAVEVTALPEADGGAGEATDPGDAVAATGAVTDPAESGFSVVNDGDFEVTAARSDSGLFRLTVHDPETPLSPDARAQHCVTVTLTGPATVETHGCAAVEATTTPGVVTLELSAPGDPMIGCASVLSRGTATQPTAFDATTGFVVAEGPELPPGDYAVGVAAISGIGDGCDPVDTPDERGTVASFTVRVD